MIDCAQALTGAEVDHAKYQRWIAEWRQQQGRGDGGALAAAASAAASSDAAGGDADGGAVLVERLKWWLGLPNLYYSNGEWRGSGAEPQPASSFSPSSSLFGRPVLPLGGEEGVASAQPPPRSSQA